MISGRLAWLAVFVGLIPFGPQQPTFRSAVDLVRLDVLVLDDGRPVPGLTADNFEVYDSGARQQIERLYLERAPMDVLLVLDNSRSVAGERLVHLREAARAFLRRLEPGDRAGIISFSHHAGLAADLTDQLPVLERALDGLTASGSTALLDALYAAMLVPGRADARRLVLAFSDGVDNISWFARSDVLELARESDAVVYAVGIRPSRARGSQFPNNRLLDDLAEAAGGRLFFADSSDRLGGVFVQIIQEIKARYLLTYYPHYPPGTPPAGWHPIRVRLKGKAGHVIARQGYYVRSPR